MSWFTSPAHFRWLDAETMRLIEFAKGSVHPDGGFGWLDTHGKLTDKHVELWVTCRMTHVFALGELMGIPGCGAFVEHGLDALTGRLYDDEHGGWYASVSTENGANVVTNDAKEAYGHAFVILAASSAVTAGHERANALLDNVLNVNDRYFWKPAEGMSGESWNREFTIPEAYRGVNANMHTVECYLAAADVTMNEMYLDRAMEVIEKVVHGFARGNRWRIPEHYDETWTPNLEFNRDEPAHPFRPYGATIGHGLEWSRLTLSAHAALQARGQEAPEWMLDDAHALFDASVADGWAVDGADGFVYTIDWDGKPVVRNRMHWVAAEALAAAVAVHQATGDPGAEALYRTWWDYVDQFLMDKEHGSWHHELDVNNQPVATTWDGKPDVYHVLQMLLVPRLPLAPTFATALAQGLLP